MTFSMWVVYVYNQGIKTLSSFIGRHLWVNLVHQNQKDFERKYVCVFDFIQIYILKTKTFIGLHLLPCPAQWSDIAQLTSRPRPLLGAPGEASQAYPLNEIMDAGKTGRAFPIRVFKNKLTPSEWEFYRAVLSIR